MNIRYVDSQLNSERGFPFILPFLIDRETGSNRRAVKVSVEVTRGHFRWIPVSSEHAQSIHMAKVAGVYATRTVYTQLAMATPPSFISKQYSTNVIFDVCLDEKKRRELNLEVPKCSEEWRVCIRFASGALKQPLLCYGIWHN